MTIHWKSLLSSYLPNYALAQLLYHSVDCARVNPEHIRYAQNDKLLFPQSNDF